MDLFSQPEEGTGKKPKITPEYIFQKSKLFLEMNKDILNAFARKKGYFTKGLPGNKYAWYQLMGNLSSTAIGYEFDSTFEYIVFSNDLLMIPTEENAKELQNLELIIHKHWNSFKKAWLITESDLWEYFQIRFSKDDSVSRKIMDSITDD